MLLSIDVAGFDASELHKVFAQLAWLSNKPRRTARADGLSSPLGSAGISGRRLMDAAGGTEDAGMGHGQGASRKSKLMAARSGVLRAAMGMLREGESVLFDAWVCCALLFGRVRVMFGVLTRTAHINVSSSCMSVYLNIKQLYVSNNRMYQTIVCIKQSYVSNNRMYQTIITIDEYD